MNWINKRSWPVQLALAVLMGVILGATASAGTLYSWITEDGTHAYTNDKKRVPARYKGEAKKSQMKEMKDYGRYTPGPESQAADYEERLKGRLDDLRGREPLSAGPPPPYVVGEQRPTVNLQGGGRRGSSGPGLSLPIGGMDGGDDPIIVEDVRMKPAKGHNTTRHFQIVRQGDKVIAVRKGRFNDTKPGGQREESEYDSNPIAQ
jgi:hypothetical protein